MKKSFILCSLALGMGAAIAGSTLSSCVDKYEYYDYDTVRVVTNVYVNDTTSLNVTLQGDTISFYNAVNIEGDTMVTHLHCDVEGDNINLNGGDNTTTITNNGTGGDRGDGGGNSIDERIRRVLKKSSLWAIPAKDFPQRIRCHLVTKESGNNKATFQRFSPAHNEKCIAYYDGGSQGVTTLAYPFRMGEVWTMGKQGSDADKKRTIYALRIENGVASIGHWGYGDELSIVQQFLFILEEEFVLAGLPACDGNNPNDKNDFDDATQRTGRTLLGVNEDGTTIYLFIAKEATVSEAYDAFAALSFCTPSRMMAVSGGSSSLGLREVPMTAEVEADEEIDLEKFVLQE